MQSDLFWGALFPIHLLSEVPHRMERQRLQGAVRLADQRPFQAFFETAAIHHALRSSLGDSLRSAIQGIAATTAPSAEVEAFGCGRWLTAVDIWINQPRSQSDRKS